MGSTMLELLPTIDLPTLPSAETTITTLQTFDRTTLSTHLPLPFRLLALFAAFPWLVALVFHHLHRRGVDVGRLIRYSRLDPAAKPLHHDIYRLSAVLTAVVGGGWIWWLSRVSKTTDIAQLSYIPTLTFLAFILVVVNPWPTLHRRGRFRLLHMLRRVLVGGLDRELRFADVLLADALTSYAKILGDTWMAVQMLRSGEGMLAPRPDRKARGVGVVVALPYVIRFRQCLTDWYRSNTREEGRGHLINAAKYASAFPVIIFSAALSSENGWIGKDQAHTMWLMAVVVNSGFSFYWDVTRDWDMTIFTQDNGERWGLREGVHTLHHPSVYYAAVVVDLALRGTWSLKLSPHLGAAVTDLESTIFVLEGCELVRRAMWAVLRVEKEWAGRSLALDEGMLLDDERKEEGVEMGELWTEKRVD